MHIYTKHDGVRFHTNTNGTLVPIMRACARPRFSVRQATSGNANWS